MFSIYHRTQIIRRATAFVLSAALVTGTYAAVIPVGSNFFETVPGLTATCLDFTRASITRGFFDSGSDFFIGSSGCEATRLIQGPLARLTRSWPDQKGLLLSRVQGR